MCAKSLSPKVTKRLVATSKKVKGQADRTRVGTECKYTKLFHIPKQLGVLSL